MESKQRNFPFCKTSMILLRASIHPVCLMHTKHAQATATCCMQPWEHFATLKLHAWCTQLCREGKSLSYYFWDFWIRINYLGDLGHYSKIIPASHNPESILQTCKLHAWCSAEKESVSPQIYRDSSKFI